MKNRLLKKSFLLSFILIAFICSCKKSFKKDDVTKENKITIGFSIDTLAIERWRRDTDVFIATAKELGANVIVQNAGNSVDEQIKQIQYLIDKNVDAIVVLAKKADALTEVITNASAKNIPVISYDRLILNAPIDLYVTIDSEKVGELMAQEILKKCPIGSLYCIYGPLDDFNMTMIRNGVEKVISGSQLRVGHIYYTDGWNYDLSYTHMCSLIRENKIPNAIICGNDALADSVIQALMELAPESKVAISGQDADVVNCRHIINGRQTVMIYKPITELSKQTAVFAVSLSKGNKVSDLAQVNATMNNGNKEVPCYLLEPVAVTKENIDSVIIDSGFHTREEIYSK
ncbi:MAG: substrate-binding domain-containing protein [Treponema sp.]|nr:substrate-binding domain-containing protein [Treponema sp.]